MTKVVTSEHPKEATIFCLFSITNDYDQPPNNLVAWWSAKPSLEILSKALGHQFPPQEDELIVSIVKIWNGDEQKIDNTDYWLAETKEGTVE